jgi:monoterpene epsilon-lactone hydrolase
MPSRRHELMAYALPRLRKSRDLDTVEKERARIEAWHATMKRGFPTKAVPRFDKRYRVAQEDLPGGFPSYTLTERAGSPDRTVVYLHGGGFVGAIDPFQVRYAARLASALNAQVVVPDYPLIPEHTWRDSHEDVVRVIQRATETSDRVVVVGDSSGGNIALAAALTVRDRGGPQPSHLLLHAPWVDLTTSTPDTAVVTEWDPWLFIGKMHAYAEWWAGSVDDLARPEVSPALADLAGLPRALMFCGTRDTLNPGCRLLARRAAAAGWDLTYVEQPGLLHVYSMLPVIPEAKQAWRTTLEFLR